MKKYEGDGSIQEIPFNEASFWVQVHDIPIRFMNKTVAESICEFVGKVCHLIDEVDKEGGSFMRVKVTLDISLPLCRGRLITLENGEKRWVRFKYKCLSNICYWCGCFDHDDKDCMLWINSKGTLSIDQQQFSSSLHAPPYGSYSKPVIVVPGFYENVDNSRPRHLVNLGGGLVAMVGGFTLHHPLMTELDVEMDTHDTAINEEDLPPKTGPQNDYDVLAGCEGSSSKSNQLGDFSLKEAQIVSNSPITLGMSASSSQWEMSQREKRRSQVSLEAMIFSKINWMKLIVNLESLRMSRVRIGTKKVGSLN